MNFTMKKPCADCPFRSDKVFPLHPDRARSILDGLLSGGTFSCHKTVDYDRGDEDDEMEDDDCHIPSAEEQHCAGATILLEKLNRPNQMMRISERLGFYDRTKLDMEAPIYEDDDEMVEAITELWNSRRPNRQINEA
jgi:hypothetical protein